MEEGVVAAGDVAMIRATKVCNGNLSLDTLVDVVEGMQFDRGYLSPNFITNPDDLSVEFEKPLILIYEDKIRFIGKFQWCQRTWSLRPSRASITSTAMIEKAGGPRRTKSVEGPLG